MLLYIVVPEVVPSVFVGLYWFALYCLLRCFKNIYIEFRASIIIFADRKLSITNNI